MYDTHQQKKNFDNRDRILFKLHYLSTCDNNNENNDERGDVASSPNIPNLKKCATIDPRTSTNTFGMELSYESAIDALKAYYSLHGNLAMPRRFNVPSTKDFPAEWHQVRLSCVYNMKWWSKHIKSKPDRVYQLNQLGFIWERLQPEWNLILEALITYSNIYGHVKVPLSFVVPTSDDDDRALWPMATWGIQLGNSVHRIRSRGDFLRDDYTSYSRRSQLDGLGFIWDLSEYKFQKFFQALLIFAKLERISHRGKKNSGRYNLGSDKVLRVPSNFRVPSRKYIKTVKGATHNPWPEEFWGFALGEKCVAVQKKGLYIKRYPERQTQLEDLGFQCYSGNATLGWLEVVHAAAIYSRTHGRVLDVPSKFTVPEPPTYMNIESSITVSDDDWPWPDQLWGLPLGQRLKDVRLKNRYLTNPNSSSSRKAQLDAMGFVWKPKRGRRKGSLQKEKQ